MRARALGNPLLENVADVYSGNLKPPLQIWFQCRPPFHALRLRDFDWHPRVTTAYYYSAVVTGSARDVHLAASRRVYPHIPQVIVDEWRSAKQINASHDGVPEEGQLGKNFEYLYACEVMQKLHKEK